MTVASNPEFNFATYRSALEAEAIRLKNSQLVVVELKRRYKALTEKERAEANSSICGWTVSTCEKDRYDALALIREFRIIELLPALKTLAQQLLISEEPGASFELRKVTLIIEEFARKGSQ